jgi:phospholipase C
VNAARVFWFSACAAALFASTACNGSTGAVTPKTGPSPASKIAHVLILVQENRSFDNLFAGYPGADTRMAGPCVPSTLAPKCKWNRLVPLREITLQTTGKPYSGTDIGHDHASFEKEYNGGKMDGFDLINFGTGGTGAPAALYPYAYVERSQTAPYWNMAKAYTLADHMFSTATTDSFVAHQQLIAGTTRINANESLVDTPSGFLWGCDAPPGTATSVITVAGKVLTNGGPFPCITQYPTMADVLDAGGVTWTYYVNSENGFSGDVWNAFDAIAKVRCRSYNAGSETCLPTAEQPAPTPEWKAHVSMPNINLFSDIKNGKLAAVSWVIPALASSDHPASGGDAGPSWVTSIVNAVGKSKYWDSTAILVVWDDWGGFYDNVAPPQLDYTSLGMRVPLLIISPYARRGYVSHTQYEFGSILKFIEQNFGVGSLGSTDVRATSIADSFDFTQKPQAFTPFTAPYPASYFLRQQPSASASLLMQHDSAERGAYFPSASPSDL